MNELQLALQCLIRENGGAEKYAHAIEAEWVKAKRRPHIYYLIKHHSAGQEWTDLELFTLKENYSFNTITDLVPLLPGRSRSAIERKIYLLIQKGELKGKKLPIKSYRL